MNENKTIQYSLIMNIKRIKFPLTALTLTGLRGRMKHLWKEYGRFKYYSWFWTRREKRNHWEV